MTDTTDTTDSSGTPPRRRGTDRSPWWYLLLLLPIVLLVHPPLYDRQDPELGGLPFFYWYQLAVVPVGVACTVVVYLKTRANGDRQ